jgi:glycosyltransferase involved in cell wall biosynthesis
VIDEGENGLLVPFGDVSALCTAVVALLTDNDLNQKIGAAGHQKVIQQYNWTTVAERVVNCYLQLLK